MNEKQILTIVQDIIGHIFDVEPNSIQQDTNLKHNFELDSLDKTEIFVQVAHRVHCNFTTNEEDLFYKIFNQDPTPQTIVNFMLQKLKYGYIKIDPTKNNILYTKSVPELVEIIEKQRKEIVKLRNQKKR
jgi:acyl carrier protein